jgi:hypothetical protein
MHNQFLLHWVKVQEGVRAGIFYMGLKNFIKAAQGTHPLKSGDFSGSSIIK